MTRPCTIFLSALLGLALMCHSVLGHTYLAALIVGGRPLADYHAIRPYGPNKDYPLADVSMRPNGINEKDMTCGRLPYAGQPANAKVTLAAGSSIGLQWWHNTPNDDVIEYTHRGPCMVYMARSDSGEGNVWFKIWEQGFNSNTRKWCVDELIQNRGVLSGITIPGDIVPGNYLLRAEIIALHDGDKPNGAQPYVHCAELVITGSGTANPSASGVAIPGIYNAANMYFNLYSSYNSYNIPGPKVYTPSASAASSSGAVTSAAAAVTTGPPPGSNPSPSGATTTSAAAASSSSSAAAVTTTGNPSPATSSSSSSGCKVSVSQSASGSWDEGTGKASQYNVVITNSGSAAVDVKFTMSTAPTQIWNAVQSNGVYGLPGYVSGGIPAGGKFEFGYIVRDTKPSTITVVAPVCDSTPAASSSGSGAASSSSSAASSASVTTSSAAAVTVSTTGSAATTSSVPGTTTGSAPSVPSVPSSTTGTAPATPSCGSVSITKTLRSSWTDSVAWAIYDIKIANAGSAAVSDVAITITPHAGGKIEQTWNLNSAGGNKYTVAGSIAASSSNSNPGIIVTGGEPTIEIVCSAPSSSGSGSSTNTASSAAATTGTAPATPAVTTTGAATNPATSASTSTCQVTLTQTQKGSWTEESGARTQFDVVVANTGSRTVSSVAITATAASGARLTQTWSVEGTNGNLRLPSYVSSLPVSREYTWGYIAQGSQPVEFAAVATC